MTREFILAFGLYSAFAMFLLLVLIAGDVRRRRIERRRDWHRRRLHAAIDRVEAIKLELEPVIDGADPNVLVKVAKTETREGQKADKKTLDFSDPAVREAAEQLVGEHFS